MGQLHGDAVEARLLTPRRPDAGFTLMEVLIAMVILSIMILGFQATFSGRLLSTVHAEDRRTVALQLAAERVRAVQLDPVYTALETRYETVEATLPGFPGYGRSTRVERTTTGGDMTKVTVTVTHPRLPKPVTRTLVVAAP
jgi:prepilin-type N-terminal cleavage/methylation domain-containing protein